MYLDVYSVIKILKNLAFSPKAKCTTLWYKVCEVLAEGPLSTPDSLVLYTNKTDHRDVTEILLQVALSMHNINEIMVEYCIHIKPSLTW